MRLQTQWFYRVVGVFTLATTLFFIPAIQSFAQASLFDPTFKVGHGANGIVYGIVVQDDGKIVVGGEFSQIAGQARTNLARLNSNGQLDASFPQGTDGAVYRLLQQPDGKILVGGNFTNLQGVARQRIGRLLTNGVVDSEFDAGTNIAVELAVFALACQSDGKVLAAPFNPSNFNYSFLNRFSPDGQLDASFVQTNVFQGWLARAICPRTNGSIFIGGSFLTVNDIASPGLALLSANGELDTSFVSLLYSDSNPSFPGNFNKKSDVFSVVLLPDSSLLIGGRFWQKVTTNRFAVAKLTPALDWDANFQPDVFDPRDEWGQLGRVAALFPQPDGKIILGGIFQEVGGYWRRNIVRLDSLGKVDSCFDPGIGLGDFGGFSVAALARQSDDKVLAGGWFLTPVGSPVASFTSSNLTRFLPQGECAATRMHLGNNGPGQNFVAATCAPGGTNHLQASTNLIDWVDVQFPTTSPYIYHYVGELSQVPSSGAFFRLKKEY